MSRVVLSLLGGLLTLSLISFSAQAGTITGIIQLPEKFKAEPRQGVQGYWRGLSNEVLKEGPSLVDPRQRLIVALEGNQLKPTQLLKPVMRMQDARFWPPVLPVGMGKTVFFENQDKAQHRLVPGKGDDSFSEMPLPAATNGKVTYKKAGVHQVHCTEVPHMRGTILVLKEPMFTRVSADGIFYFPELPNGEYTLKVWQHDKWIIKHKIEVKGKIKVKVQIPSKSVKE